MEPRTLIAVGAVLVLAAAGGFYFALSPRPGEPLLFPSQTAARPGAAIPPSATVPQSAVVPYSVAAAPEPPQLAPPSAPPQMATAASIEAEIALSDYAEVLAFVKENFKADYDGLIDAAVGRRNEGVSDEVFGQQLAARMQSIMRDKLKYGAGASMPTIDRLAANEASLFHTLGTEGAGFCLKMLGQDDTPAADPPPENVRRLMQRGTLYRFQAIAEGVADTKPVPPLSKDEIRALEASVSNEGLNLKDVNSGAFLKAGAEPGKPCLAMETFHLAIARLPDSARRKIYAGMFFLGRNP